MSSFTAVMVILLFATLASYFIHILINGLFDNAPENAPTEPRE